MLSRSCMTNRYPSSPVTHSRNCCSVQCAVGCRVTFEMKEPSRTDFHNDEDVHQLECRRHHNKEVASDDGFGVIAHKCPPALLWVDGPLGRLGHVTPHRAW